MCICYSLRMIKNCLVCISVCASFVPLKATNDIVEVVSSARRADVSSVYNSVKKCSLFDKMSVCFGFRAEKTDVEYVSLFDLKNTWRNWSIGLNVAYASLLIDRSDMKIMQICSIFKTYNNGRYVLSSTQRLDHVSGVAIYLKTSCSGALDTAEKSMMATVGAGKMFHVCLFGSNIGLRPMIGFDICSSLQNRPLRDKIRFGIEYKLDV